MFAVVGWIQAAAWGLAGGLAAGLVGLMTAVTAAGFKWPWRKGERGPRLFVVGSGMLLGALVAAAAHSQMSGGWPAFVMGAGAPATIRGLLTGVEVSTRPPAAAHAPHPETVTAGSDAVTKDEIHESAD